MGHYTVFSRTPRLGSEMQHCSDFWSEVKEKGRTLYLFLVEDYVERAQRCNGTEWNIRETRRNAVSKWTQRLVGGVIVTAFHIRYWTYI